MLTISEMQTQEFNHEGLFYHNGQGTNGGAAVVPPRGLQWNPFQMGLPKNIIFSLIFVNQKFFNSIETPWGGPPPPPHLCPGHCDRIGLRD